MIRKICVFLMGTILFLGCSREPDHIAQGYIEGKYTYVSSYIPGELQSLFVKRGDRVTKGQTLFQLEQQPESDAYRADLENLHEAQASRDAIKANLSYAKITYERYQTLVPKGAIQQAQLDNAKSVYNATLAQLAQANATVASVSAALAQAKWRLEQKKGYAPLDAWVFDTYFLVGEYVEANKPILSLLTAADIKVIFYIPEPMLAKVKLGDGVLVSCNGCSKNYRARISFISPSAEYTPPVIYSRDTNEKLIYRIEAEFSPNDAYVFHPGQPVYVQYVSDKMANGQKK